MQFDFSKAPAEQQRRLFLDYVEEKYKNTECYYIGKSILGKEIHCFRLGKGKRNIVTVGTHHAAEFITGQVLWRVLDKMCAANDSGKTLFGVNLSFLFERFSFWFVPILNPDGIDMHISGIGESPLSERQLKMNGGSENFFDWQANARGVDLNHNYDFGFAEYKALEAEAGISPGKTRYSGEYPESEPEAHALASFIRTLMPELVLSLHTQGEEIYYRPRSSERVKNIAKRIAKITAYDINLPEELADYGGLSDYCGEVLGIPSFTLEIGKGKNPIPPYHAAPLSEKLLELHCLLPSIL